MKKLLAFCVIFAVAVGFAACGDGENREAIESGAMSPEVVDQPSEPPETEPEPELEPQPEPEPDAPTYDLENDDEYFYEPQSNESDEIWHDFLGMTFSEMRESIAIHGAAAFEDATGWNIVFDDPADIVSITEPHVMARGYSSTMGSFIHVLFTYRHWRDGWRVNGYAIWDDWNVQPQVTRGRWEGRRHVDAEAVDVRFYGIVDWGGGQIALPVYASIPGDIFAEEFIRLFRQYVGTDGWEHVTILDMWFIGSRLYVNLDDSVVNAAQGSAAGYAIHVSLYRTLFSIPGVEEIVVLVDGQTEVMSDHIGFGHIDRRDDLQIQLYLELSQ